MIWPVRQSLAALVPRQSLGTRVVVYQSNRAGDRVYPGRARASRSNRAASSTRTATSAPFAPSI